MPIKKFNYCKTRMNKVVWGMTSQDDYENADDFTEFRGCIITEPTESWRCDFCNSKIIPSHTPEGGLCLEEAPAQLTNALRVFASRINQIADLYYLPDSIERSQVATLQCGGYEVLSRRGFGYSFDHLAADQTLGPCCLTHSTLTRRKVISWQWRSVQILNLGSTSTEPVS